MSRKAFTPEQQQILRSNPYTIKVTRKNLYLSKDLKELFYKEYMSGALPKDILQKYGYPADILGRQRIYGIAKMIREQYEQEGGFRAVITPGDAMAAGSPEEKLLNAFDLVRLHKFAGLDERCHEDTPITRLPSYKAMSEMALGDGKVREQLARERLEQAVGDFAQPTD